MAKGKWQPITIVKQKQLARKAAIKAFGLPMKNHQVGKARKLLMELVDSDFSKYMESHVKYCTPRDEILINDTAEKLKGEQGELF